MISLPARDVITCYKDRDINQRSLKLTKRINHKRHTKHKKKYNVANNAKRSLIHVNI